MEVLIDQKTFGKKALHLPHGEGKKKKRSLWDHHRRSLPLLFTWLSNFKRGCISAAVHCTVGGVHPRFVYSRALFCFVLFPYLYLDHMS